MNPVKKKIKLWTIGHSTRSMDELLSLLREFKIEALVDIRRFPGSHRFPHFNREALEKTLPAAGIEYIWIEDLGGRRSAKGETSLKGGSGTGIEKSLNAGLKSAGFRYYADYMQTEQFRNAAERLLSVASVKPVAIMCAEKLFWKCHRRLLSDYLFAKGVIVEHIIESGRLQSHKLSAGAVVTPDMGVIYSPAGDDFNTPNLFD